MKVVISKEWGGGKWAKRYTAVLLDGSWWRVSRMPNARRLGWRYGAAKYAVDVADDAIIALFSRSRGGDESVVASNGMEWDSFAEAHRWAAGRTAPKTCPHCGRPM